MTQLHDSRGNLLHDAQAPDQLRAFLFEIKQACTEREFVVACWTLHLITLEEARKELGGISRARLYQLKNKLKTGVLKDYLSPETA